MRFDQNVNPFLKGQRFSNGLSVQIAAAGTAVAERMDVVTRLSAQKTVLHVGFADHLDLIDRKRARGVWLHDRLRRVAKRCVGVDTNAAAVGHLIASGLDDVYCHDIVEDAVPQQLMLVDWDLVVLGEMLEHTDNPVTFLKNVREKFGARTKAIALTVPNAFAYDNLRAAMRHQEVINTDHRYWFTPYTLGKVCVRAGWSPVEFFMCEPFAVSSRVRRALLRRMPALCETLVMIAEPG